MTENSKSNNNKMTPQIPRHTFANGKTIPVLGLGTWQSAPDGSVYRAVKDALEVGYRALDCAFAYENEAEIGQAITDSIKAGVLKREDLFVTSKIWLTYFRKDRVPQCAHKILSALQLDYIDLLLLHWPVSLQQQDASLFPTDPATGKAIGGEVDYLEAYHALELLVDQGLVRSIGVSNFNVEQLERLLPAARIKPVTNQVELHPYLVQADLKEYCHAHGIVLTAYSPLGNPGSVVNTASDKDKIIKEPVVLALAAKYHKNVGQILIRYQLTRGNLVIPKSVHKERIASNLEVFDFDLTHEEVAQLDALDRGYRSCAFDDIAHIKNYPF